MVLAAGYQVQYSVELRLITFILVLLLFNLPLSLSFLSKTFPKRHSLHFDSLPPSSYIQECVIFRLSPLIAGR